MPMIPDYLPFMFVCMLKNARQQNTPARAIIEMRERSARYAYEAVIVTVKIAPY